MVRRKGEGIKEEEEGVRDKGRGERVKEYKRREEQGEKDPCLFITKKFNPLKKSKRI